MQTRRTGKKDGTNQPDSLKTKDIALKPNLHRPNRTHHGTDRTHRAELPSAPFLCLVLIESDRRHDADSTNSKNNQTNLDFDKPLRIKAVGGRMTRGKLSATEPADLLIRLRPSDSLTAPQFSHSTVAPTPNPCTVIGMENFVQFHLITGAHAQTIQKCHSNPPNPMKTKNRPLKTNPPQTLSNPP